MAFSNINALKALVMDIVVSSQLYYIFVKASFIIKL